MAARRLGSSECCAVTFCSNGSTCRTGRESVPNETIVCRSRHLLETYDLGRRLYDEVQRRLAAKGLKVATGTIVDALFDQERQEGA
jgi:hypothetical protein